MTIMKKALVLILAGIIAFSAAACNNNDDNNSKSESNSSAASSVESKEESKADDSSAEESKEESSEAAPAETVSDPYEVLTNTWNNFADDEKFSAVGGDMTEEHLTDGAPGRYNLEDASTAEYALDLPSAQFANVDSAASLMHMMNANTFTGVAFHVKEGVDVEEFTKSVRDYIQGKRWMCGFPDELAIYVVGECVVSCYGYDEIMESFKNNLLKAYPDAVIAYEENINT